MHALLRPPSIPLWPPRPSWGVHTHLSNSVCPSISPYIHQNPLEFIGNTHTNTGMAETEGRIPHQEQIEGNVSGNTIGQFTSALEVFFLMTFLFSTFVLFSLSCPSKPFRWTFLSDSLPVMFFHHNKSLKEPEGREKSDVVWLQGFFVGSWSFSAATVLFQFSAYCSDETRPSLTADVCVCGLFGAWWVNKEESDCSCQCRFVLIGSGDIGPYNFPLCWLLCGTAVCMCV